MTEERKKSLHPISEVLLEAYNLLLEKGEVNFPIHESQINNIDSVVKTVNAEYFGLVRFPTSEEQASAYLCFLIKDHPVTDGNKRLAILWLDVFCHAQGLVINESVKLDELAVGIEKEKEMPMDKLIQVVQLVLFG